jgi:signal transduction histidine kinase
VQMVEELVGHGVVGPVLGDEQPGGHIEGHAEAAHDREHDDAHPDEGDVEVEVLGEAAGHAGEHAAAAGAPERAVGLEHGGAGVLFHEAMMRRGARGRYRGWPAADPERCRPASGNPLIGTGPRRRDHRGIPEPVDSLRPPPAPVSPEPEGRPESPEPPHPGAWPGPRWDTWHEGRGRRHRGSLHFGAGRRPLRRQPDDRIFAGVAGGISRRCGIDVTFVRIGFVLFALFGGFGAATYLALWLVLPMEGQTTSIAARAAADRRGIVLALAFLPALLGTLIVFAALHVGFVTSFAWPLFVGAAALVLIWRNCDPEERAWLHGALEPVIQLGAPRTRRRRVLVLRLVLGAVLLGIALVTVGQRHPATSVLRPITGALLVVAAIVVLFGPWWLRLAREMVAERQARARAEDRADMAARVHDSVLQTLALIQRSAQEPQRVVQLARAQERELRAWLFDGDLPGGVGDDAETLVQGMQAIAKEVEADHRVPVDVVTVSDCLLDDRLRALLAAAREATVNAAKWSGAPTVSLFAEVESTKVSVFVRDRGKGFDADDVAEDRRGIAESIQARMLRQGGRAVVLSAPGEGTEVRLSLPLERAGR